MASDRYDEQARAWLTKKYGRIDSLNYQGGPTSADAEDLAETIRTAAQEAQLRVLDTVKRSPRSDYCETSKALDELRARIEKEGPL